MYQKLIFNFLIWCCLEITIVFSAKELPPFIQKCKLHDPNLNKCLVAATEMIKPYLIKGIPELVIPPIEPLKIPEIDLEQGTDALNFKAKLVDLDISGLSSYKFSQFDFDVPNLQWFFKTDIDSMQLKGKYNAHGRILVVPFEGEGLFAANFSNWKINGHQKYQVVEREGEEYLTTITTKVEIDVSQPRVQLLSLQDDNSTLTNVVNQAISDNIDILFEDLRPAVEKIISQLLERILTKSITDLIPFKNLYSPEQV